MYKILLLILGTVWLCGCSAPRQNNTETEKTDTKNCNPVQVSRHADKQVAPVRKQSVSGKSEADSKRHPVPAKAQTAPVRKQSVSGTFCGDKDVSDDF